MSNDNGQTEPDVPSNSGASPSSAHPGRVVGFLCEKGAYTFFDLSSTVPRLLPRHFMALPVTSVKQVQIEEVLKAFFAGAAVVLIAGCETCRQDQEYIETQMATMTQALARYGIEPERLCLEWIEVGEEEKFIQLVNTMAEHWHEQPSLRLSADLKQAISHCG